MWVSLIIKKRRKKNRNRVKGICVTEVVYNEVHRKKKYESEGIFWGQEFGANSWNFL